MDYNFRAIASAPDHSSNWPDSGNPQEKLVKYVLPSHPDTVGGHRNAPMPASTVMASKAILSRGQATWTKRN
jgi:hypothetical protein